ncbi:TPA: regulatory protein GemA [Morganella morganii]|nr:regulatory protein GemA [Morganella morganii]HAT1526026.1 regulatory protein GemA [Morganella morganii]HDF2340895.1 regulatory protein GemA [Morganella morganii]HDF2362899.1 regulatory protein GemA [Morganella morganii]HDF2420885.1 regulatory protein GemA [Morganella morganii]
MLTPNAKKQVGIIKAAQQYLKMDDETYRRVLVRLTGKDSATKLTPDELGTVRDYFHAQGYPRRSPKKYGRKPNVPVSKKSVLNKIEALLADAGRPWEYAESMAERMFNRQKIDWLDHGELTKLMQALTIDQKRRRTKA